MLLFIGHKYFHHDKLTQKYSFSGVALHATDECGTCGACGLNGTYSSCGTCSTCGTCGTCSACGTCSTCGTCSACGTCSTCGTCSSCGTCSTCGTCGSNGTGACGTCGSCGTSRRLCTACDSCCSTSGCTATGSCNPYIPRFQEYQVKFPLRPYISPQGPLTLLEIAPSKAADYPVGIAVNGVLFVSEHYNVTESGALATIPMVKDFDNCGGHGDSANRYHYHAAPICLLLSMGATIPTTGVKFLYENTSASQAGHWPSHGKASPLLGYALDGFPIYGPYNASGVLQVAGMPSAEIDECLFSAKNKRYHMTPNFPFSPPCLVGVVGEFTSKLVNNGICPVIDSAFCSGDQCQPLSIDCDYIPFSYQLTYADCLSLGTAFIFTIWWVYIKCCKVFYPDVFYYPYDKIILSMLPSALLLLAQQLLYKAFYGLDKLDWYNFDLDMESIETSLNDGVNSFLAVTGVLYSLIIAQIFMMTNEKFKQIRDTLSEELSGCRQVALCLQAIHSDDQDGVRLKEDAIAVVVWYLGSMIKQWGDVNVLNHDKMQPLDLLYGSLSIVVKLCKGDSNSNFNVQVADRIMESMNSISSAKYRRCALADHELPFLLWVLQYLMGASMFLGVLLIQTGSRELNLGMCYVTTILIGMNTLVIADMDLPYHGHIKVEVDPVVELFQYLNGVVLTNRGADKVNLAKQASVFFSSKEARRNSMEMVSAALVNKFQNVGHHSGRQKFVETQSGNKENTMSDNFEAGPISNDDEKAGDEISQSECVSP